MTQKVMLFINKDQGDLKYKKGKFPSLFMEIKAKMIKQILQQLDLEGKKRKYMMFKPIRPKCKHHTHGLVMETKLLKKIYLKTQVDKTIIIFR